MAAPWRPSRISSSPDSLFRFRLAAILVVAAILVSALCAFAQDSSADIPRIRAGKLLIGFNETADRNHQKLAVASVGATEEKVIGKGVHVLQVLPGHEMQTIEALKGRPEIRYAEPDYLQTLSATPNDPSFSLQWGFLNTGQSVKGTTGVAGADESATKAWNVTTGSRSIVVAVVDTGIQYNHPDLAANVWSNPGGINGCAAGTHGYNVLNSTCDPLDDDTVYNGHGSHVAGIIGAVSNNGIGVAGVNWQTTLLAVKWVNSTGTGATSDLISALDWVIKAKQAGVNIRVVNDSQTWVGTASSQALSDEIDLLGSNDILFVSAAGNTSQNNDTTPRYPCVYARSTQICVAASDQSDNLASFSNYGANTVDLAAPGSNIYSTLKTSGSYGYISGCSMSAAQVSGAAALVLSQGYKSVADLRTTILSAVDPLPAFASVTRTGGRLNICKAIVGCGTAAAPVNTAIPAISGAATVGQTLTTTNGSWSGSPTSFSYQWNRCDTSGVNCSGINGASASTYKIVSADAGSTVTSSVTASNSAGSTTATSSPTAVVQNAAGGFSLVQQAAAQGTSATSIAAKFPGSNTAGNLIVVFVRASSTTQTVSVSDTAGNAYSEAVGQTQTSDGHQVHIYYAANVAGAANTVTASFSGTNSHPWLAVYEYSGLSKTNPLDRTAHAQGRSTAASSGTTATTRTASELVFAGVGLPATSGASVSAGSGYALEQQNTSTSRAATEDRVATDTGSFAGTFTLGATVNWSAVVATFSTSAVSSPLAITTTTLPAGTQNTAYSSTVSASGGVTPYSWSIVSGALPAGLTLNSSTGAISGTPTGSGSSNFTVQVKDANASTATQALSVAINAGAPPIAFLQSSQVRGTSVASLSQAFPSATTAGNLIIVFVRMSSSTQTVSVSDSAGNSYADAVMQAQTTDGHQSHIFYARNIKGGPTTVTVTFSATNNHPWLAIFEYSGLNADAPLDQTAHAQGSSSTPSSGLTGTTTTANELVFAGLGLPNASTLTVTTGAGFIMLQQDAAPDTSRAAAEAKTVSTTGQYSGTFSLSGSTNWSAVAATFKP